MKKVLYESRAQTSAEYLLIMAGIIVIVLIIMNIYQDYILSFENEMADNEVKNLINKIDEINNYI